jgi:TolB protein
MLTVAMDTNSEIWIAPLSAPERVERLTTLKNDADFGVAATSDGRIVFVSAMSGRPQLWIANRDGSARKLLLPGYEQPTRFPAVAPSGEVVFLTREPRGQTLAAVRLDGSGLRLLTPVTVGSTPAFTPDGRFMIYTNQSRGLGVLFKIPMAGGSAEKLTDYPAYGAAVSPDGKWIAAACSTTDGPLELCVIPIEGGPPINRFPLDRPAYFDVEWSPDGKELLFIGLASDANRSAGHRVVG